MTWVLHSSIRRKNKNIFLKKMKLILRKEMHLYKASKIYHIKIKMQNKKKTFPEHFSKTLFHNFPMYSKEWAMHYN